MFGEFLVQRGLVTREDVRRARAYQLGQSRRIGVLAMERYLLSPGQVLDIRSHQRRGAGLFGEVAVTLGHLTRAQVEHLLWVQRQNRVRIGECLVKNGALNADEMEAALHEYLREASAGGAEERERTEEEGERRAA